MKLLSIITKICCVAALAVSCFLTQGCQAVKEKRLLKLKEFLTQYRSGRHLKFTTVDNSRFWDEDITLKDGRTVKVMGGPVDSRNYKTSRVALSFGKDQEDVILWNYSDFRFVDQICYNAEDNILFLNIYKRARTVQDPSEYRFVHRYDLNKMEFTGTERYMVTKSRDGEDDGFKDALRNIDTMIPPKPVKKKVEKIEDAEKEIVEEATEKKAE